MFAFHCLQLKDQFAALAEEVYQKVGTKTMKDGSSFIKANIYRYFIMLALNMHDVNKAL